MNSPTKPKSKKTPEAVVEKETKVKESKPKVNKPATPPKAPAKSVPKTTEKAKPLSKAAKSLEKKPIVMAKTSDLVATIHETQHKLEETAEKAMAGVAPSLPEASAPRVTVDSLSAPVVKPTKPVESKPAKKGTVNFEEFNELMKSAQPNQGVNSQFLNLLNKQKK